MTPTPRRDGARQVDQLCDHFEAAWRAGQRPDIGWYLDRVDPAQGDALFRELLALEIELRGQRGETPTPQDYAPRFPAHAPAIAEVFATSPAAAALPGETQVTLSVVEGPHQGRSYTFSGHDTFLVGRSKRTHFQLIAKDMYFSRFHFLVEVNPPRVRVTDMKSRNGTWVNDQRVQTAELRDGDRIKAGHTILQVAVRGGAAEAPAVTDAATLPPAPRPSLEARRDVAPAAPPRGPERPGVSRELETPIEAQVIDEATAAPRSFPDIPGYRLERELGRGGMGVVYRATELASGATVALKTIIPALAPTPAQIERFLREARILEQLRHPNIVAFRAMGETAGLLWFAMEFVAGTDLAKLVKSQGPLPIKQAVRIACHVLQALAFAHEKRFVHRDIKPANILLGEVDGKKQVKVADFGLARVYQTSQLSGLTLAGDIGGTVKFMPPEQITHYREVKPPGNQYAAAATLYHMLTGQHAYNFGGQGIEAIALILDEEPVPIRQRKPDIPKTLADVIHRGLAREPRDRFATVGEFRKALLPFA